MISTETVKTESREVLNNFLSSVSNDIVQANPGKVSHVFLMGSFGRGEGQYVTKNNRITFISDIEIGIIPRRFIDIFSINYRRIGKKYEIKYNVEISISLFTRRKLRNNKLTNLSIGSSLPTIYMYDIKKHSKLLYGDYLEYDRIMSQNQFSLPHINDAYRTLMNRIAEYNHAISSEQPNMLGRKLVKIYLSIVDIILIRNGFYTPFYGQRAELFAKLQSRDKEVLSKQCVQRAVRCMENGAGVANDELGDAILKDVRVFFASPSFRGDCSGLWEIVCKYYISQYTIFRWNIPFYSNLVQLIKLRRNSRSFVIKRQLRLNYTLLIDYLNLALFSHSPLENDEPHLRIKETAAKLFKGLGYTKEEIPYRSLLQKVSDLWAYLRK